MGKTPYIIYYQMKCGLFRVIRSDKPKELLTYERLPDSIKHKYHAFKGYEASDQGLLKFGVDFRKYTRELNKKNCPYRINYLFYYSHHVAVENVFKKLTEIDTDEKVSETESIYMSWCYNGGLTYCDTYEGQCYGYDYNSFYPRCLANMDVPMKEGKEVYTDVFKILKSGSQKLKYGMYYVRIQSDNPDAIKIFSFSKHDVYTHYSIEFAWQHRKRFKFKFAFYHTEINSYVYDTIVPGSEIFGNWMTTLTNLRKTLPKNKLLKHLLSSLWGCLTRYNTLMKTYEDIDNEKLDVGHGDDFHYQIHDHIIAGKCDYYVLRNNRDRYRHSMARLKPFLVSYARNAIANIALKDIDSVIRIHTDGVCFTSEQDMTGIDHILPEDKTTGNLKWEGKVNKAPIRL